MKNSPLDNILRRFNNTLTRNDYLDLSETADSCMLINQRLPYPLDEMKLIKYTHNGTTGVYGEVTLNKLFLRGRFLTKNDIMIAYGVKESLEIAAPQYKADVVINERFMRGPILFGSRVDAVNINKGLDQYGRIMLRGSLNLDLGVFAGKQRKFEFGKDNLADQLEEDIRFATKCLGVFLYVTGGMCNVLEDLGLYEYAVEPDYKNTGTFSAALI